MAFSTRVARPRLLPRLLVASGALSLAVSACRSEPRVPDAAPESPQACEERRQRFIRFLEALPERSVASAAFVNLPLTTLGVSPGTGPVLEVSPTKVVADGEVLPETTLDARVERVSRWLSQRASSGAPGKSVLYVAASSDLDVRSLRSYLSKVPETLELKLLVRTDTSSTRTATAAKPEALEMAKELLSEQDPERRAARSLEAYRAFASCTAFDDAVVASSAAPRDQRWPARRKAMIEAASQCHCSELDTGSLQQIASAEQRAGAAGLGALPAAFLRDHRCEASMPQRSIGKLVTQMEAFDAEFAGDWQNDALRFEEVLSNERLLNYFCNALPGEALASWQRANTTLYFRPSGANTCQAWRFEPLSRGAPMGTLRRVPRANQAPLALHYWQAAEEIRLFGPVPEDAPTKATDQREWACEQKYRLSSVDSRSIETETGRFFLDESACLAASPKDALTGCVSALAASGAP
jgi:hypothetical protein